MTYKSPFQTKQQICDLSKRYLEADANNDITDKDCLAAGLSLLEGVDERRNLRIVVHWKLQAFVERFAWARDFPNDLIDDEISHALIPARRMIDPFDKRKIGHALMVLDSLPGVGIPVASAILMAMHPNCFTVIDRQAYRALSADFRDPISPTEYFEYLAFCREQANLFGVNLRKYHQALWEFGSEI